MFLPYKRCIASRVRNFSLSGAGSSTRGAGLASVRRVAVGSSSRRAVHCLSLLAGSSSRGPRLPHQVHARLPNRGGDSGRRACVGGGGGRLCCGCRLPHTHTHICCGCRLLAARASNRGAGLASRGGPEPALALHTVGTGRRVWRGLPCGGWSLRGPAGFELELGLSWSCRL